MTPKTMTAIATQRVLLTSGRLFGSLLQHLCVPASGGEVV